MVYVIFANYVPKAVSLDRTTAVRALRRLAAQDFTNRRHHGWWKTYQEYRKALDWYIHEVPLIEPKEVYNDNILDGRGGARTRSAGGAGGSASMGY